MLTQQEQEFIRYWERERREKKKYLRKLSFGLPLGVLIAGASLIGLLSGWHKKADMMLKANASVIIVILIAVAAIIAFMVIFSARHQWDQREQHYQELLARQEADATN